MYYTYTDIKINLNFCSIEFTLQNLIRHIKQMKKVVGPDFFTGSSQEPLSRGAGQLCQCQKLIKSLVEHPVSCGDV